MCGEDTRLLMVVNRVSVHFWCVWNSIYEDMYDMYDALL